MWHHIKDIWTHNRYLLIAFMVVISLAGFFGVKATSQFIYWADPAHQDQPLAGWMTPRYVGQSYRVPRAIVQSAFALDENAAPRRISLESLAAETGKTLDQMQIELSAAVADWRAANPEARP